MYILQPPDKRSILTLTSILFLFLAIPCNAEIYFTEIMYEGYDWVEIYSDETINMTKCKFLEAGVNHKIIYYNDYYCDGYCIIADKPDNVNFTNMTIFDSRFSLSKSGESLALICNGTVKDNITYETTSAGNSLQLINNSWIGSVPTPGKENIYVNYTPEQDLKLEIITYKIYLGEGSNSLFKITNLAHITGQTDNINLTVNYNITKNNTLIKNDTFKIIALNFYKTSNTGQFQPSEAGNYTLCGNIINSTINDTNLFNDKDCKIIEVIDTSNEPCNVSINISTKKLIYDNKESIKFYNNLNNESYPFQIEYWIDDLFNFTIKNKYNTTNTNQKSYTPNIDDSDKVLVIKSTISWLACNDSNLTDNYAEKIVIVKGNPLTSTSSINITKVYTGSDEKVKFGESLRVKANVYKGDETKDQLKAYIEDEDGDRVSTVQTSINLYREFTNYQLTIPIQIKPNCKSTYDDGIYYIVLKAFDTEAKEPVMIEGISSSNCITITKSSGGGSCPTQTISSKFEYELISFEPLISKSSTIKVKLTNNEKNPINAKIWSYIYRGSKSYSGEREQNIQEVDLAPGSSIIVELNNIVDAKAGDYKLKVKIRKNDQKTTKDITKEIKIGDNINFDVPFIKKFYTNHKKATSKINLYAELKNIDNDLKLNIESFEQSISKNVNEKRIKTSVNIFPGKNIYFAILKDDNKIYDIKQLILGMDQNDIKVLDDKQGLFSGIVTRFEDNVELKQFGEVQLREEPMIVYESSAYKAKKLIPYFIILVSVFLNIVLIWKR